MCGGFALFLEQTHPEGGKVRARLPAKPMNSVSVREPRSGKRGKDDPRGGKVRARLPAKSMNSVSEREPRAGRRGKDDPGVDKVRARLPAKSMNSVSERNPGPEEKRKVNNLFIRKTYLKARAFMVE